jgi:hypothetical protein
MYVFPKEIEFLRILSSPEKILLSTKNFFHPQTSYPHKSSFYHISKILFVDKKAGMDDLFWGWINPEPISYYGFTLSVVYGFEKNVLILFGH